MFKLLFAFLWTFLSPSLLNYGVDFPFFCIPRFARSDVWTAMVAISECVVLAACSIVV